jgi:hypothetical protein
MYQLEIMMHILDKFTYKSNAIWSRGQDKSKYKVTWINK